MEDNLSIFNSNGMMKKNELSKVVLSLLILFIGTLILDRTVGYAMNKGFGLLQNGANVTSKMKYTLYDMNAECVILGSSRANHHYITKTLSDSLNITVYNAGRDGHGLMYAAGLFCGFTSRYVPKLIIMEVGYDELEGGWSDKISNLKPFIKDFPCIENVQGELLGKNELIKNNLYSYRYNSMSINLMRSFLFLATSIMVTSRYMEK